MRKLTMLFLAVAAVLVLAGAALAAAGGGTPRLATLAGSPTTDPTAAAGRIRSISANKGCVGSCR